MIKVQKKGPNRGPEVWKNLRDEWDFDIIC